MFTPAQLGEMREKCLKEFEELLRKLSISIDWNNGDEYEISEKFDEELEQKLSTLMKSSSVIAGYSGLLKLGGIPYEKSDVDSEILGKIVANKEKIIRGIRNQSVEYNSWKEKYGGVSSSKEQFETLSIEATNVRRFNMNKIISELENAKSSLQRNSRQSNASGLEAMIRSVRPWVKEYSVASKTVDLLQALLNTCETDKQENFNGVCTTIDNCISKIKRFDSLFESKRDNVKVVQLEELSNWIQEISSQLHENESGTVFLTIKKSVETRDREIPPKPTEPKFNVNELEEALHILEQLNEIVKQIKG